MLILTSPPCQSKYTLTDTSKELVKEACQDANEDEPPSLVMWSPAARVICSLHGFLRPWQSILKWAGLDSGPSAQGLGVKHHCARGYRNDSSGLLRACKNGETVEGQGCQGVYYVCVCVCSAVFVYVCMYVCVCVCLFCLIACLLACWLVWLGWMAGWLVE